MFSDRIDNVEIMIVHVGWVMISIFVTSSSQEIRRDFYWDYPPLGEIWGMVNIFLYGDL